MRKRRKRDHAACFAKKIVRHWNFFTVSFFPMFLVGLASVDLLTQFKGQGK